MLEPGIKYMHKIRYTTELHIYVVFVLLFNSPAVG